MMFLGLNSRLKAPSKSKFLILPRRKSCLRCSNCQNERNKMLNEKAKTFFASEKSDLRIIKIAF